MTVEDSVFLQGACDHSRAASGLHPSSIQLLCVGKVLEAVLRLAKEKNMMHSFIFSSSQSIRSASCALSGRLR